MTMFIVLMSFNLSPFFLCSPRRRSNQHTHTNAINNFHNLCYYFFLFMLFLPFHDDDFFYTIFFVVFSFCYKYLIWYDCMQWTNVWPSGRFDCVGEIYGSTLFALHIQFGSVSVRFTSMSVVQWNTAVQKINAKCSLSIHTLLKYSVSMIGIFHSLDLNDAFCFSCCFAIALHEYSCGPNGSIALALLSHCVCQLNCSLHLSASFIFIFLPFFFSLKRSHIFLHFAWID